jgi:hypothetical protein
MNTEPVAFPPKVLIDFGAVRPVAMSYNTAAGITEVHFFLNGMPRVLAVHASVGQHNHMHAQLVAYIEEQRPRLETLSPEK